MPKKSEVVEHDEDMLPEYDFSEATTGMFADKFGSGSRVVLLDADVAEVFPTAEAANEALRDLAGIINRTKTSAKPRKSKDAKLKKRPSRANAVK
jgi:hypothetical protein